MRYTCLLLLILTLALTSTAQQKYDVSLIPKELLVHASAVIRNDETVVEVKDLNSVNIHYKQAITVLNKNGDGEVTIAIWHDKSRLIKYIKTSVYDEFGKLKSKVSENDFEDGNIGNGSLFDGTKLKRYRPAINTYPYTVEYEYEISSKQTLNFEDWTTGQSVGTSVENSVYKFICKPDFNIHYKETNFSGKATITDTLHTRTYTWLAGNLKALRYEPLSPNKDKLLTRVKISPEKFSYYNIPGVCTTWKEYGKWTYDKLLKDRHELSPQTIAHIQDLTRNATTPKQKAKIVYEYMQQKTRYISVQVGIGGFQPFLAKDVDQLGYGDCKALVNYTQSLLEAVGVESYYVEVKSGSQKISFMPDFASGNQGDHIILCMPFKNDTTWVDCTSKEYPFGYLGEFTDDRYAVACTPNGGILLHTPVYKSIDNKQLRNGAFALDDKGTLSGEMVTRFEGTQYDNRDYLVMEPLTEQIKMLKEVYPIENLDIQRFDLKQDKSLKPSTTETIKLQARDYIAQNGGRFYFTPNAANRNTQPIKEVTNRMNPVYINRGYFDQDDITYTLPAGYNIATKPLNITIDKPFGKYTASIQVVGDKLIYKRVIQINDGTYDKDIYQDVVDFYQSVYEADRYTISMEKK